jgi:TusE/DsrC/DsvC family sulfur relay protein
MLERTGNGYLVNPDQWSEEIMFEMAKEDEFTLTESMVEQIKMAREYYDENAVVPPIRKFAKYCSMDQKEMFKQWMTGPMKPITKYGGLPQPTGCV